MDGEFLLGSGHLLATEGDIKSEHRDGLGYRGAKKKAGKGGREKGRKGGSLKV